MLDEGLVRAAQSARLEAIEVLPARGAHLDADPYRGTALAWATAGRRLDAIRRLVELGADVNGRTTFGGDIEGATALHLAAQGGSVEVVRTLLDLGADPSVVEPAFNGTPAQWAEHFEHEAARELLNDTSHPNPPPQGGRA